MIKFTRIVGMMTVCSPMLLCSCGFSTKETHTHTQSEPTSSIAPDVPNPASTETVTQGQGLVGSVWIGDGQSGDGMITYVFHFNQEGLSLESACLVAETSSTLKSDLAASYSENGNTVELKSGLQSTIPAGQGSCTVNFPVGLKFQLDHDQIFIEYDGTRRPTKMKRQN